MREDACALVDELVSLMPLFRKKFLKPLEDSCGLDLTPMQCQALFIIYYKADLCMGEISEELQVSKQQLTKIINGLEELGCVTRYQDTTNRRNVRVKITDLGKSTSEEIRSSILEKETLLLEKMSEEDRERLLASIHTIKILLESEK